MGWWGGGRREEWKCPYEVIIETAMKIIHKKWVGGWLGRYAIPHEGDPLEDISPFPSGNGILDYPKVGFAFILPQAINSMKKLAKLLRKH